MAADLFVGAAGTAVRPLGAVHAKPSGRTHTAIRSSRIDARSSVLAAEIRAAKAGAFVHVHFAGRTLPGGRTEAPERVVSVDASGAVFARVAAAFVRLQSRRESLQVALDGLNAPAESAQIGRTLLAALSRSATAAGDVGERLLDGQKPLVQVERRIGIEPGRQLVLLVDQRGEFPLL